MTLAETVVVDPPEDPVIWSAEELAQLTGVAKSTICRWADTGRLPTIRKFPGRTGVWVFTADAPRVAQELADSIGAERSFW